MGVKHSKLAVSLLALSILTGCNNDSGEVSALLTPEVVPDSGVTPQPDSGVTPLPDSGVTEPQLPSSLSSACQLTGGSLDCQQPVTNFADLADISGLTAINLNTLDQQQIDTLPTLPGVTTVKLSASTLSSIDLVDKFPDLTTLHLDSFNLTEDANSSARSVSPSLADQLTQMTALESLSITNSDKLIGRFGVFPDLSQHTNLHTLDLSGNVNLFLGTQQERVLPLYTAIRNLNKLTSLSLEITGLGADDNAPLQLSIAGKNLTTLKLAHNETALFANEQQLLNTIIAMSNLETLTVSGLEAITHAAFALAHWPKLIALGLNNSTTLLNQQPTLLTDIISRSWQGLGLASNQLTLSAQNLANLQPEVIRELDISGNTLDQTPDSNGKTLSELIASFTNLEVLDLSNLELTSLPLGTMSKLHTLDLGNNQLADFALSEGQMPALQMLNLVSNGMTTLSVGNLPMLQTLDLRLNQFTTLAFAEGQMPVLQSLDLSMNPLTELTMPSFPELETLSLTNSSLTSFAPGDQPALKTLDMSYGKLTSFTSGNLPALEVFDLEGNKLTEFDASNMPALQNLRLRNNQLTTFTTSGNPQLLVLHLGQNSLTVFASAREVLPKLQSLNLEGNQLTGLTITEGQLPEMSTLKVSLNSGLSSLVLAEDQRLNGTTVEAAGTAITEEVQAQLVADNPTVTFKFTL